MWSAENRGKYERKGQRYPSDVTDEEWALVEPRLPPERRVDRREVLNAILYVLTTGCQWEQLSKDFQAKSTVHDYFVEWHCDGTLTRIHHALYAHVRELAGRQRTATTAIVDSQSVKGAEKGRPRSILPATMRVRNSKGKKRHGVVDTLGLMVGLVVTPGDIQDRDAIAPLLKVARKMFPSLARAIADGGYQAKATGEDVRAQAKMPLEIVKRSDTAKGFVVLPKRWIAPSAGSAAAAGSPRTSRTSRARTLPSSSWP